MRERKLFGVKIGAGVLIIISCITVIIIQSTSAEENGTDEIILNFSFTEPEITEVNISNTTYQIVTMNETKSINNEGLPVLPVKPLEILLPQNGTLKSINVNYSGKTSIGDGYNILLGKQSMSNYSEQQNETNETKFNFSEPYPTDTFNYFGTNYFHGFSILVLNINPVYYTVETGEIYYYKNMSVTITINKSGSVHSLFRGLQLDEISMKQLVNDYSMNYTYTDVCTSSHSSIVNPSESYDYVIITTENLKDASPLLNWREWYTFQDLVDYKNAHGTTTTIVAVEDIDENYEGRDLAEKIRNFIIDAYKNWNTNYILIGGDANKIPVRNLWGYSWPADPYGSEDVCSASDLYYACLDGSYNEDNDDKWGEVFDGAPGGDYYEPPRKPSGNSLTDSGNLYAEADSNQYGNGFNVGLFTPSLDLTGINSIKLTFSYNLDKVSDYEGQDIIFLDINTYSGGTNLDKHNLWHLNTNNKGFITLEFDPSTYTDPSDVYVEFYYSDIGASSSFSSLNIDEVLVYTNGDEKLLEESFESNEFPPIDWTQIVYSGDKYWNKEYYRIDVDLFPEIYIGRACVGNKMEVRNFVLKTLSYENIPTHDPYLKKVLLIGGKMHDDPEFITWGGDYKDGCIDFNNEYIETYGIPSDTYDDIDTLYDRDWENNWWDSCDFRNKVNPGVFILNAALHGDEFGIGGNKDGDWTFKFTNIDVDLFTNNKCSFLYFQSCLVGNFSFESYDCFAEHFTVKTPHGAFATIMNSKSGYFNPGTTDGASQRYDREFWDAIFGESQTKPELKELGPANEDSKLDNYYLAINPDYRALQYSLNLFGDPQISIKIPEENYAPNTPTTPEIYSIYNNRWYTFSTSTTDPNGDQIQYKFKWDNHESLFWTQWYNSGQVAYGTIRIPVGTHQIRVKARDVFNYESEWSDPLPVTVPFDLDIDIYSSTMVLGEEIQFYGTASDAATEPIKTWNYNLADGSYANVQNINHTYSKVGTYNVTLTVIDNENITSNVTKVVRIVLLKSDINCSSDHGTPNETILFNDSSDSHYNIINWHWDFGDGDTSNNRNTSHAYNTEGAYNVTLTITDSERNTNISYRTIYIDINDPELTSLSSDVDEIGYGYTITLTAYLSDSISGIKTATVNVTYPNDTYGNFTMNNTDDSTYEYVFNDTCQLGKYNYTVWTIDNAENFNSSSQESFTVLPSFGYQKIGNSNQSIGDTITGTRFKANLKGIVDNISVYIDPGNATSNSHYQCIIYRHNDSKLIGISEEKNVSSIVGWQIFNFSNPKPVLMNNTDYILVCWADNYSVKMYYNNGTYDEMYYDDGTSSLQGHYFEGVYNHAPESVNFEHEDRYYSIYCRFTPDNAPPEVTDVSDTPDTIGFGFNVTITADIIDNVSGINIVKVIVTYPDDTTDNFTMNNINESFFMYVFSDTWLAGQYNYTIWTVDNCTNSNNFSGHHFHISAQATISIATLKDSYSGTQYINITDPPNPPENLTLVDRGLTWNTYYNTTSGENILETYQGPVNYQEDNSTWTPINNTISQLATNHPAYVYGYRTGNDHGLYGVYFKSNAQQEWPVAFTFNRSDDPTIHAIRSKLVGVGYVDPQSNWAYQYLQNVQSSQGQTNEYSITYPGVFTGVDVTWSYGNVGLKEEITLSNTTKTVLQNHPPSQYGLNDTSSYLVFITKLDYQNLDLYNGSGLLDGNATISDRGIEFKDALGQFKCALPLGEAYELNNETARQQLTYRIIHLNGNTYLLSGLKLANLNVMTFPVVIDPTLTVNSLYNDGFIYNSSSRDYTTVWEAPSGTIDSSSEYLTIGQKKAGFPISSYYVYRSYVLFNTTSLPANAYLDSAILSLYKRDDYSTTDFDLTIQSGQPTYPQNPLREGDYDKEHYSGDGGSYNTAYFVNGRNNISITELGWINDQGITKLCLRSSRDINGNAPTGNEYINVYSTNAPLGAYVPKLIITYRNQSKIKNIGETDINGYLLIQVQYYNTSQSTWVLDNDTINETTSRTITNGNQLALDTIFNGQIRASELTHGTGTYRVYTAFRDPEGNILRTNDDVDLEAWWQFNKT